MMIDIDEDLLNGRLGMRIWWEGEEAGRWCWGRRKWGGRKWGGGEREEMGRRE